jgi:hypothetical protein
MIGYIVLTYVTLGPPALAVINIVLTADEEWADHVAAFAGHDRLAKAQL